MTARLDVRNPLVLDTRELSRRAGSMTHERREVPAPDRIGTEVVAVPQGGALEIDLRLESVVEGVLVTGTVQAVAAGSCVRCLEPVSVPVSASFTELFAYPDTRSSSRRHQEHERAGKHGDKHGQHADRHAEIDVEVDGLEDEVHELVGDLLDLEPVIRDAVVPSLPFQPVCRPDCPGLCVECGALLAGDPGHHHASVDPRWASLHVLLGEPVSAPDATPDATPDAGPDLEQPPMNHQAGVEPTGSTTNPEKRN